VDTIVSFSFLLVLGLVAVISLKSTTGASRQPLPLRRRFFCSLSMGMHVARVRAKRYRTECMLAAAGNAGLLLTIYDWQIVIW
jgi:hypothetical protein